MSFEDQVGQLTTNNINGIETEHASAEHWILMTMWDKYGFRTNSPTQAMKVADEIIVLWPVRLLGRSDNNLRNYPAAQYPGQH